MATVLISNSRQVRMMRMAISPRLAIRILRNMFVLCFFVSLCGKSNDDGVCRPPRIVTNHDLFSGGIVVGTLLLQIAESLGGFVENSSEHVGIGYLGDATVIVGHRVDNSTIGHATGFRETLDT